MQLYELTEKESIAPVCYNGNLCTTEDIQTFSEKHPQTKAVMLGRALVGDPAMLSSKTSDIDTLQSFTDALLEEYIREFGGARNAMFRLKENWRFILCMFDDNQKLRKKLLKTTDVQEFRSITNQILHTLPLRGSLAPDWDL
jgi:tRNA-dihydrouridine synthase